jgi:hypothetical protein
MRIKKQFLVSEQGNKIWDRLRATRDTPSESAAFVDFLHMLDAGIRWRLEFDPEATAEYEAGTLTQSALQRAFDRRRAAERAAANGGAAAAAS